MRKWNSPEWEALLSGEGCPICLRGKPLGIVAELGASYLTSGPDGPLRGYCSLALKRHAVEVYDLNPDEARSLMEDLRRATEAIHDVTGAVKMNYEIHGNTIPRLHVHLFPRYRGDPFEDGPVNPRHIRESPYGEGEQEKWDTRMPDKAVYLLVVEGFADWEPAHAVAELRRHGGYRIETVGLTLEPVQSMGGICVLPSTTVSAVDAADVAAFILPGGDRWENSPVEPELEQLLKRLDREHVPVAAICGATVAITRMGL